VKLDETNSDSARQDRLNEVLLAYVEGAQAGRAPDRRRLIEKHPEFRHELEEFFSSHDEVARLMEPLREVASASGPAAAAPSASGADLPEIGRLGDFRLLREVGRGGMGVVYEAEQISLRRRVALKVLPFAAAIDQRQLQRFQNEALAAAHLRHENIVPVHAVGNERGVHYYAMQFIEGRSLAALIDELRQPLERETQEETAPDLRNQDLTKAVPPVSASAKAQRGAEHDLVVSISRERSTRGRRYYSWLAGLGRQAALALEHAHQAGIVHRDIKPANLLLDTRQQLWVADFGLAQFSSNISLTVTGEILGTLRYASPEQALAKRGLIDHRSDIYSLGASLYELLTLRPIFEGRDRQELLRQIAHDEPINPRSVDRTIPEELETIILKAIAKEPSERYASAQALADDLESFREDRPISARRPSALERSARWGRRHKSVVASALVGLLLAVAGLGLAVVLVTQAYDRERQRSSEAEERFRLARRLADEMIQIAEQETANDPEQQLLRRRMLEVAVAYYQEFIELRRENPGAQADLENTQGQVKTLLADLAVMHDAHRHTLLRNPAVQAELKVTDQQRERLNVIIQEIENHKPFDRNDELPRASAEQRSQQMLREMKAHESAIAETLTAGQLARLRQIALQERGVQAFQEPEIITALELTREQRQELRELCRRAPWPKRGFPGVDPGRRKGKGVKDGPPGGRDGNHPPGRGPRPDSGADLRQALALLTSEQRKRYQELVGPLMNFEPQFPPGRRGPPADR
jgi:serine/threonine protein kinase